MRKIFKENGITLIALVITIIVLLILAGVSIAMLTGENGILTQAQNSKIKNIEGEEREQIGLAFNSAKIKKQSEDDNSNISSDELKTELNYNGITNVDVTGEGTLTVKFIDTKNVYTISQNGKIEGPTEEPKVELVECSDCEGSGTQQKYVCEECGGVSSEYSRLYKYECTGCKKESIGDGVMEYCGNCGNFDVLHNRIYQYKVCEHYVNIEPELQTVSCVTCGGLGKVEKVCDTCSGSGQIKGYVCNCGIVNNNYSRGYCYDCGSMNIIEIFDDDFDTYVEVCSECKNSYILLAEDKVKYNKCGHIEEISNPIWQTVTCTDCNGTGK